MTSPGDGWVVREVRDPSNPDWTSWRAIYYESFPRNERMSEAHFEGVFERMAVGEADNSHLLVMVPSSAPGQVVAMAYCTLVPDADAGFLWYLATHRDSRNQGVGARLYAHLLSTLRKDGAKALLFEVEIPDVSRQHSLAAGEFAERRIAWYRRQGAQLLGGVRYFQKVDTPVPATEMHVMVHPFVAVTAVEAYALARRVFGNAIQPTGPLTVN